MTCCVTAQMCIVGMGGSFPVLFWIIVLGCWSVEVTLVVVGFWGPCTYWRGNSITTGPSQAGGGYYYSRLSLFYYSVKKHRKNSTKSIRTPANWGSQIESIHRSHLRDLNVKRSEINEWKRINKIARCRLLHRSESLHEAYPRPPKTIDSEAQLN